MCVRPSGLAIKSGTGRVKDQSCQMLTKAGMKGLNDLLTVGARGAL